MGRAQRQPLIRLCDEPNPCLGAVHSRDCRRNHSITGSRLARGRRPAGPGTSSCTWRLHSDTEDISLADAEEGVRQARRRLGSLVYQPALADTSEIDRTFLLAMAKDDGPSKMADIQERLGVDESYVSQYRLHLIAAELIEPTKSGHVDFALPYLREFLCDEAAGPSNE